MELGNKEAKTIVKYSMQLAMLRKLLSVALITEAEYEKILGTPRKDNGVGKYISKNSRQGFWGKRAIEAISSKLDKDLPGLRFFFSIF